MEKDNTDFHAIPVDDKEEEGVVYKIQLPMDCFSILCGVLAAVLILFLLAAMIYYFCAPSIVNKK